MRTRTFEYNAKDMSHGVRGWPRNIYNFYFILCVSKLYAVAIWNENYIEIWKMLNWKVIKNKKNYLLNLHRNFLIFLSHSQFPSPLPPPPPFPWLVPPSLSPFSYIITLPLNYVFHSPFATYEIEIFLKTELTWTPLMQIQVPSIAKNLFVDTMASKKFAKVTAYTFFILN